MQLISENCDPGYCCSPWENRILFTGFAVPLHYLIILLHYFIIYAFKNPLRSIKMLHLHCSALGFFRWFFSSFSSAEVSLESQNPSGSLFQCQVVHVQAWALAFLGSASHSEEGSSPCALGAYSRDLSHPVLFWPANGPINIFIYSASVCAWSSGGHEPPHKGTEGPETLLQIQIKLAFTQLCSKGLQRQDVDGKRGTWCVLWGELCCQGSSLVLP